MLAVIAVIFLAFLLDWILGDPQRWPHPVRLIGRLILWGERRLRLIGGSQISPGRLRLIGGILAIAIIAGATAAAALLLQAGAYALGLLWFLICLYLSYSAISLKELYRQTWRVEQSLINGNLEEAKRRLSWVVGRDTGLLNEAGVRRALIETIAENFSDGVVAPLLYLALGGPALAWGYKAVNTLDSMVGYKNFTYINFGRFSARIDDAANFIPARLSAFLLILSARLMGGGFDGAAARRLRRRDGRLHASPNSGQPEAAMAGALGLRLGGPSHYRGLLVEKPFINQEGREPGPGDVKSAETLMVGAALLMLILAVFLAALAVVLCPDYNGWFLR